MPTSVASSTGGLLQVRPIWPTSSEKRHADVVACAEIRSRMNEATISYPDRVGPEELERRWSTMPTLDRYMIVSGQSHEENTVVGSFSIMWAPNGSRCQISIDVDPRGGQKSSGGSSEGDVRCQMVISFILKWFAVEGIARSYFAVQQRLQQVAENASPPPGEVPVVILVRGYHPMLTDELELQGYTVLAKISGMAKDLMAADDKEEPLPQLQLPEGIELVSYHPETHAREVYNMYFPADSDQAAALTPFESWYEGMHSSSTMPDGKFNSSYVVAARSIATDSIIAASYLSDWRHRRPGCAFINGLIVADAWRRQRIALNLLFEAQRRLIAENRAMVMGSTTSLGSQQQAARSGGGLYTKITLNVENESPTNTKELYVKFGMKDDPSGDESVYTTTITLPSIPT